MKSLVRKMYAIGLAVLMAVLLALPAAAQAQKIQSRTEMGNEYYQKLESAPGVPLTEKPTLTIKKYVSLAIDPNTPDTDNPIQGVEFKYAKVGNLYELQVNATTKVMAYGITKGFASAVGLEETAADYQDNENLYFKSADTIQNATRGKTAADLKNFLVTVDQEGQEQNNNGVNTGTTDSDGSFKAELDTQNPWGLYLVVEYDVSNATVQKDNRPEAISITKTQAPFIVTLPTFDNETSSWVENVTANVKNSTDTADVEKKIVVGGNESLCNGSEEVADTDLTTIGDTVHFRLKGTVLDIPENSNQSIDKYVLTDVISAGLDPLVEEDDTAGTVIRSVHIDAVRVTGSKNPITLGNVDYTVSVPEPYNNDTTGENQADGDFSGGKMFTITLTENGLQKLTELAKAKPISGTEKAVYFYYSATVNKNAVIGPKAADASTDNSGNPNKVKLNYQVSGSAEMATRWDKVSEFTYAMDVTKDFDGEDPQDINKVTFKLYSSPNGGTTKTYYSFQSDGDGSYYGPATAENEASATALKLDANKKISIKGLDEGTYYLVETETAAGYNLLKEPVQVQITAEKGENNFVRDEQNSTNTDYLGTAEDLDTGTASLTVINTKGFTLPSTGGAGIWMFVIGGIVIIAAGGAYFLLSRKKNQ